MMKRFLGIGIGLLLIVSGMVIFTITPTTSAESEPPYSSDELPLRASVAADGGPNIASWAAGCGARPHVYIKLSFNSTHYVQVSFVVLNTAGALKAATGNNASITTSSLTNVNTDLAYFNFSVSNSGDFMNVTFKFARNTTPIGESYIDIIGTVLDCTDYSDLNETLVRINTHTDSWIDNAWWEDVSQTPTQKPSEWTLGLRGDESYIAFQTTDDKLIQITTNSGNLYGHMPIGYYSLTYNEAFIGTLASNRAYAQKYDVDGRLIGAIKLTTPLPEKIKPGNILWMMPLDYAELVDLATNETIYELASEAGISTVFIECFLFTKGTYVWNNASIEDAILDIRNFAHDHDMYFVLPCYWWGYTAYEPSTVVSTYSLANRTLILEAWANYVANQGDITDEYSIGWGELNQVSGGWSWWNLDMMNTIIENATDKPFSIWGPHMWYLDERVIYLNTEGYKDWQFDDWDAYYTEYGYAEPVTEMCGAPTWFFDLRVTAMPNDNAAMWTGINETLEMRVVREAFLHGAGLTVFYEPDFYSATDGFSLSLPYCRGFSYRMNRTVSDLTNAINGTQYEDRKNITITLAESTGDISIVAGEAKAGFYRFVVYVAESFSHSLSVDFGDFRFEADGILNVTFTERSLVSATWTTDGPAEDVTFTVSGLDSTQGYRAYKDGQSVGITVSGPTFTFDAVGEGTFTITVWNSATVSRLVILTVDMLALGLMVGVVGNIIKPLKDPKNHNAAQFQKVLINTVVCIVIGVVLITMVNNMFLGG